MSGGLMLKDIIMNLFMSTTEKQGISVNNCLFSQIKYDKIYLYKGSLCDYSWKKTI